MPRPPEIGNVQLYPNRPLQASDKNGYVLKFYCPIQRRRIRRNCGTRNRREARRILRECRERLVSGKYAESGGAITELQAATIKKGHAVLAPARNPSGMSWQDCYDCYRKHRRPRGRRNSLEHSLSRLSIAERILEGRREEMGLPEGGPIEEYVTLESLEYLQDRLLAGDEGRFDTRAPMTVNTTIGAVMAFVRYCHAHEWVQRVPKLSKLPVDSVMQGRPVTEEEFSRMLDAVPDVAGERSADSWSFTLKILWESAFRVADVMDFSWDDARPIRPLWPKRQGDHPTLVIPPTQKNRKAQEIPMLPGLYELLDTVPQDKRSGWVANPERIDSQPRSSPNWFKPVPEDLVALSANHRNAAIARACGVTETAVRKWLEQVPIQKSRPRPPAGEVPHQVIAGLRKRFGDTQLGAR